MPEKMPPDRAGQRANLEEDVCGDGPGCILGHRQPSDRLQLIRDVVADDESLARCASFADEAGDPRVETQRSADRSAALATIFRRWKDSAQPEHPDLRVGHDRIRIRVAE